MPTEDLDRLRAAVLADPQLQQRLLAVRDRRAFVASVVAVAGELGLDVVAGDVEDALLQRRRAWYSTWI